MEKDEQIKQASTSATKKSNTNIDVDNNSGDCDNCI